MPPVADADHDIGLEPAVVPLLLLRRFEMGRVGVDADLTQSAQEQVSLRRKARRRRRIVIENEDFHRLSLPCRTSSDRNQASYPVALSKRQNASVRGVARASQESGAKP